MGCLNSNQGFNHWFSNIHLSGPCNRSCYFCIGQHMMGLDRFNNLNKWPLDNIEEFVEKCREHNISEVNLTGTNTDPMLYKHLPALKDFLKKEIPDLVFGIRTNGVAVLTHPEEWKLFDKGSITFPSFDPNVYKQMMGSDQVPDLFKITRITPWPLKVNIVLSPYDVGERDEKPLPKLIRTLMGLQGCNIKKVNLREPYGQPHVGDPLAAFGYKPSWFHLGMPVYEFECIDSPPMLVCYWDVHYCEVESVNLYANGRVSVTYPITKGYTPEGTVIPQSEWGTKHERHFEQWTRAEPRA